MDVVAPGKDVLLDESSFQVPRDFEPQLLVLVYALNSEIVNPEILVEVLDHSTGHFLIYGHFGGVGKAGLFDESGDLLRVPLGDWRYLLSLKCQVVLVDLELDDVCQFLDVSTRELSFTLL